MRRHGRTSAHGGHHQPYSPVQNALCKRWDTPQKRGDGIGYSGHKHEKGEKVIAIIDNHGYVLAPVPVAPVNETDMVLLPEGLTALKQVAKEVGVDLRGAYLNLDGGFDSRHNRKLIFNAGMMPNIKENPRNRKTPKRGRKRFFNKAIHARSYWIPGSFETSSSMSEPSNALPRLRTLWTNSKNPR